MRGSSPLVGSSSRSRSADALNAATSATFCLLPLEYSRIFLLGSRSNNSISSARLASTPVRPGGFPLFDGLSQPS